VIVSEFIGELKLIMARKIKTRAI